MAGPISSGVKAGGGNTMRDTPSSTSAWRFSGDIAAPVVISIASGSRPADSAVVRIVSMSSPRISWRPGKNPSPSRPARRAAAWE